MPSLDVFGMQARDHLKEYRPKTYRQLFKSGRLMPYLLELQERATKQYVDHILNGLQPHEAEELISELLFPPSEEDVPELGQSNLPGPEIIE